MSIRQSPIESIEYSKPCLLKLNHFLGMELTSRSRWRLKSKMLCLWNTKTIWTVHEGQFPNLFDKWADMSLHLMVPGPWYPFNPTTYVCFFQIVVWPMPCAFDSMLYLFVPIWRLPTYIAQCDQVAILLLFNLLPFTTMTIYPVA